MDQSKKIESQYWKKFCEQTFLEYNSFKRYQLTIKSKKNYNYVSEDKL